MPMLPNHQLPFRAWLRLKVSTLCYTILCRNIYAILQLYWNYSLSYRLIIAQEPRWYVDDGCHSECRIVNGKPHCTDETNDDIVGEFQPNSFAAGIRCCSDDRNTCKDNEAPCCKTQEGACPGDATHSEAEDMCLKLGMRLCTKDELLDEICCKTGGNCDSYAVWTSTIEPTKVNDDKDQESCAGILRF